MAAKAFKSEQTTPPRPNIALERPNAEPRRADDSDKLHAFGARDFDAEESLPNFSQQWHWIKKFRCAFRGLRCAIFSECNFVVHFAAATLAIGLGMVLAIDRYEWLALGTCIGFVLTCELFNSALECLSRAVTRHFDPDVRNALDISSSAVLAAAITASAVGGFILARRMALLLLSL